jgi:hypothetical protein
MCDWVSIAVTETRQGVILETAGMSRYGLPEIEVTNVPPGLARQWCAVLTGVAFRFRVGETAPCGSIRRTDGKARSVTSSSPCAIRTGVPANGPPAPPGTSALNGIYDVLPVSSTDVWASGIYCTNYQGPPFFHCTDPVAQLSHWNGTAWDTAMRLPGFIGATSISPGPSGEPQWVGLYSTPSSPGYFAHVTGTTWSAEPGPPLSGSGSMVTFTAHIPGTDATWGAGYNNSQSFTAVNAGRQGS